MIAHSVQAPTKYELVINLKTVKALGVKDRNTAEGFYAGLTWGVLWPLAALDRPAAHPNGTPFWGVDNALNASAAQILRTFFGIRF